MISCVQREPERVVTLANLEEVGIVPKVSLCACDPAGPSLNRHVAFSALRDVGGSALFLEDDIFVREWFPKFIVAAERLNKIVTFCVMRDSLYPGWVLGEVRGSKMPAKFVKLVPSLVRQRRGFYGTQAVLFPEYVVRYIQDHKTDFVAADGSPKEVGHGFDFWLKEHADALGGIWAAVPNPVQHRNPPKMKKVTTTGVVSPNGVGHVSDTFQYRPIWGADELLG